MPQTQISCPNCRQKIPAQVEQLFDQTSDPGAKQRLIGGTSNRASCPFCGYEGMLSTPIIYHDASKELLLTFFPPELGLPVNEQEKMFGPLINQVVNKLPAEKRKGYLLRPQSHLTYQSLVERILAADGITPDMVNAQQKRVDLIQRLLTITTPDVRSEVIKQEGSLIDEAFFALLSRLMESALASNQESTAQALNGLQQQLLSESEYGKKVKSQISEMEAAVKTLQDAGQELTREKLIGILLDAPNEDRLRALVSLTRAGLDYNFFQILSERIEQTQGEDKSTLETLRKKLLDYTIEIDRHLEEQYRQAKQFIENIIKESDIEEAMLSRLEMVSDITIQALNEMLREASQKKDTERLSKLQQVVNVIQKASTPPPEYAFLERLLDAPDDKNLETMLNQHDDEITEDFVQLVSGLIAQFESQPGRNNPEENEIAQKLHGIYKAVLRRSMRKSWQSN